MFMDFKKIVQIIIKAINENKPVEIYYPQTDNNPEGWRQVKLHSVTTDIFEQGEEIVLEKEPISPGHIVNAYDILVDDKKIRSFIIGKIKYIRFI